MRDEIKIGTERGNAREAGDCQKQFPYPGFRAPSCLGQVASSNQRQDGGRKQGVGTKHSRMREIAGGRTVVIEPAAKRQTIAHSASQRKSQDTEQPPTPRRSRPV